MQIKETNVAGIDWIALDQFLTVLVLLAETVQDIANKIVEKENPTEENKRRSRKIYDFGVDILHVYNNLHQDVMRLINDPILILEGDAGVGKSHLIADVVLRREKEKQMSLLFGGQKFITDEDPFTQMMRMLFFSGTSNELLEMLEAKAEATGHRIIIFIDAINEGHGLTIWQRNIRLVTNGQTGRSNKLNCLYFYIFSNLINVTFLGVRLISSQKVSAFFLSLSE